MLKILANPFIHYATFTGRATRREFWAFAALFSILTLGAHAFDQADGSYAPVAGGMGFAELIMFIVLVLPFISVSARRLHDADRSGWWLMILHVPYLGFVLSLEDEKLLLISSGALVLGAAILVIKLLMPGSPDANRFGSNPRLLV